MTSFIKELMSNSGLVSSSRFINVAGAITGSLLLAYDVYSHGKLDSTAFGIYLTYCGGVYAAGKGISALNKNDGEIK